MLRISQSHLDALQAQKNAGCADRLVAGLAQQGIPANRDKETGDVLVPDKRGKVSRVSFNKDGLIDSIRRPSGSANRYSYDREARVRKIRYADGTELHCERNRFGQVTSVEVNGRSKYEVHYDAQGRPSEVVHPDGKSEKYSFDDTGTLTSYTDRSGAYQFLSRSPAGESAHDCLERSTQYHTLEGGLSATTFADGSQERYAVDPETGVAEVRLRNAGGLKLASDDEGRPGKFEWSDGSTLELKFDDKDRLVLAKAPGGAVERVYDDAGRVAQEISDAGAVACEYDPDGRLAMLTDHHGEPIQYRYDEDGRVSEVTAWDGRRLSFRYSQADAPTISFPNGCVDEWSIRSAPGEITSELRNSFGQVLSSVGFSLDECDRIAEVRETWGARPEQSLSRSLSYDAAYCLRGERDTGSGKSLADFAYDPMGNMISDCGKPVVVDSMDCPSSHGDRPIQRDALGNVTAFTTPQGPVQCRYTLDGRLAELEIADKTWSYTYDGLGRRVKKTDGTEIWTYGWYGCQLLWEQHLASPDAEPVRRDYLYLPGGITPLGFREKGKCFWIQSDPRGAVIAIHDESGGVVWRGVYDSFGKVREVIGDVRQPWRLAGQYFDPESGLHYNLARYYSPDLKVYLSLDPRWQEREATNYSYARNDPWNRADPLGTIAPLVALGVIAAGAVIGGVINTFTDPSGPSWSAFGKGALIGGATAAVGILAAIALPAVGIAAASVAGLAIIGAVEGAAGSVITDLVNGNPICVPCMLASAALGAALGVALPFVGGFAARALLPKLRPLLGPLKNLLSKLKGKPKPAPKPKPNPGGDLADGGEFDGFDLPNSSKDPTPPPSAAEKAAKEAAEKEAAEKAAKEAAEKAVKDKMDNLRNGGPGAHGPQRHGPDITEQQLKDRAMHGKDPMTGTTTDGVHGGTHGYGKTASKVNSEEAFAKAADHVDGSQGFKDAKAAAEAAGEDAFAVDTPLADIYGPNYKDNVSGVTRTGSKNNPTGTTPADFTDGTMKSVYKKDPATGEWYQYTMYPNPKP